MCRLPRRLPTVRLNGKTYFIDDRLEQLSNVTNPHDWVSFADLLIADTLQRSFDEINPAGRRSPC